MFWNNFMLEYFSVIRDRKARWIQGMTQMMAKDMNLSPADLEDTLQQKIRRSWDSLFLLYCCYSKLLFTSTQIKAFLFLSCDRTKVPLNTVSFQIHKHLLCSVHIQNVSLPWHSTSCLYAAADTQDLENSLDSHSVQWWGLLSEAWLRGGRPTCCCCCCWWCCCWWWCRTSAVLLSRARSCW